MSKTNLIQMTCIGGPCAGRVVTEDPTKRVILIRAISPGSISQHGYTVERLAWGQKENEQLYVLVPDGWTGEQLMKELVAGYRSLTEKLVEAPPHPKLCPPMYAVGVVVPFLGYTGELFLRAKTLEEALYHARTVMDGLYPDMHPVGYQITHAMQRDWGGPAASPTFHPPFPTKS